MERIRLLSSKLAIDGDRSTLNRYMQGAITKQNAMDEICKHNKAESMTEEYFDYLVNSTGYNPIKYRMRCEYDYED